MANKKTKKSTTKTEEVVTMGNLNYKKIIFAVLGILLVIFLGLYFNKWYDIKQAEKVRTSYLIDNNTISMEIKNINEVKQVLKEAPNEFFVLISYTENKDTYNLEKKLKPIINKYKLNDRFYYLNVNKIMEKDDYIKVLNDAFNTDKITTVPTILYNKSGEFIDATKRYDKNMIGVGDFQKLLDTYDIKGQ